MQLFFQIHIHCKIISSIVYILFFFFFFELQSRLQRYFVCMLHTSNRERWSHLVYAKDEDELEEAELFFFDAEAAPLSTFASLTSWGAGMPIGELSWSIAALWSAMSERFAGAKPFSLLWIVNSMSCLNLTTRTTPFDLQNMPRECFNQWIDINHYNHKHCILRSFWNKNR